MIRLIASDVDGTLLPEGTPWINPDLLQQIRSLQEQGIVFVAASGRQYDSILNVLGPLRREILFIADNGAYIIKEDELLFCSSFSAAVWRSIIQYVRQHPDERIMMSSVEGSFTTPDHPEFRQGMSENYGIELKPVEDLTALDVHVTKIGVYCDHGNPKEAAVRARELFGTQANILVSGDCWMDFVPMEADKGLALARVQEHLGIRPEETAAFGDNINDMGMLRRASESYAVSNARPEVKAIAKHVMQEGAENDGVLHVLQSLSTTK